MPTLGKTMGQFIFPDSLTSLHRELDYFTKLGASNLEALRTATIYPAQLFNLESEIGSLSVGKSADIVLTKLNPFESLSNSLKSICTVISKGYPIIYTDCIFKGN